MAALDRLQDVVYYGIVVILLLVGAAVTVATVSDFLPHDDPFSRRVSDVVNGVLFVVIVLELLRTVLAHFEDDTFHLSPS
ncbi:MAG: phosphate-starvation-inducible PsiE family protein [Acidimicrobiales bacterium]